MIRVLRVPAAVLLAALVPACHGDGDGGGGSAALFSDEFNRAAVGTEWSASGAGGTQAIDAGQGNPAPGLGLAATEANGVSSAQTQMTFNARPLTVSVDVAPTGAGEGGGGVAIVDASGTPLATAERSGQVAGSWTVGIGTETQTFPSGTDGDDDFETLTFNVDEQGNATWSSDGRQMMTRSAFPAVPVSVQLFSRGGETAPFPTFGFDNVRVTSP